MDVNKTIDFLESSFLSTLLTNPNVTDISFNGQAIYYLDNLKGRMLSSIIVDPNDIKDFLRQIANLCEKQFSYQTPILDLSVGRYRINAVHQSIGRKNNDQCLTFSIRLASKKPIITNDSDMLTKELISLFNVLLESNLSIVIGGLTGSGKTEFQKYLISQIKTYSRLIIIDNVLELDNLVNQNKLDLNTWQVDEKNQSSSIQLLVKNALRSNPDWLIVAESRGKEMLEVLNSAMTGHPIITTIHALDIDSMPHRIARMVMMADEKMDFDSLMFDIHYHFRIYVYLKREIDNHGLVHRYIQEVSEIDEQGNKNVIYASDGHKREYFPISKELLKKLSYQNNQIFINTFTRDKK